MSDPRTNGTARLVAKNERRRKAAARRKVAQALATAPAPYRVTSDAYVRCSCGVQVWTESHYGGPPTLPASCWRCLEPLG